MMCDAVRGVHYCEHGVVRGGPRPVTGVAVRCEPHMHRAALSGRDRVEASGVARRAVEPRRMPAALTDGRLDPVEEFRMGLDEPQRTVLAGIFFIGDECEYRIPTRPPAVSGPLEQCHEGHGDHVLHVSGTPAPDVPVGNDSLERRHGPVRSLGRHDVEVAMHEEAGQGRIRAGNSQDNAPAAIRRTGDKGLVAGFAQQLRDEFSNCALAIASAAAVVGGVEADKCRAQFLHAHHAH